MHDYFKIETEAKHRQFEHERQAKMAAQGALAAGTKSPLSRWLLLARFIPRQHSPLVLAPVPRLTLGVEQANS